jgi:YfiH family protein
MGALAIEDRDPGPPGSGHGDSWPRGTFASLGALPGIVHLVTTRDGPAFGEHGDDPESGTGAAAVARRLAVPAVAWTRQVHGGTVLTVDAGGYAGEADALVTTTAGLAVLGRSADCPLVLAAAPRTGGGWAVGFAHASWRSTVAGITGRMIGELVKLGAEATRTTAVIAPSAGPCCYEVGSEVREAALMALGGDADRHFRPHGDRWLFDLWTANTAQLAAAGVDPTRVACSDICTICRGERFWSWRVQGEAAGRFAAAIAIR